MVVTTCLSNILLVPVHKPMHWCLIVVDMDSEEFIYLDSKSGEGRRSLTILSEYLQQEHLDKKQVSDYP